VIISVVVYVKKLPVKKVPHPKGGHLAVYV